ncbi:MAG: replication-associated recombination protein A [Clostridia bacterium]|nr:replication-associated recombination protein A [Clostridia bacterium]
MKAPLADRIRPQSIDDIVGQKHLLGKGKALRNIIESGDLPNLIFYGPSGIGKTTLASIIALKTNRKFHKLNGTSASTADIKAIVAELDTLAAPNGILLYLDEIQYFNKKQQQTLLDYIERGEITLIASTTENPYFYIHGAILSRCTVFEFKSVDPEDIIPAVKRAFSILEADRNCTISADDEVLLHIARSCGGDVRKAMNSAELCVLSTLPNDEGQVIITKEKATELTQKSAMKYDREGDEHYDILSAFQKSMRGSDANAALHYLARLLEAGDLSSATRRLMVCAAEDVGLAYPMIIPIVKSAVDMALMVGLPEARIPLADAVVLVCNSPKSNSAYLAYDAAASDIRMGKSGPIPRQLQNMHFDGEDNNNKGQFYQYPHDYPYHYVSQQYLPDVLKNKVYYQYGDNKTEQAAREYWEKIKK